MDIFGAIMLGDQFQMSQSQNVTKKKATRKNNTSSSLRQKKLFMYGGQDEPIQITNEIKLLL